MIVRQPFVENGYLTLRFPNMVKVNIHEHWTRVTRFNPLWVSVQTYIVKFSRSILNISSVHLNGIWPLIWRYLSKPVLGGHPVLSGHYSIPRGCPLNTGFTVSRLDRVVPFCHSSFNAVWILKFCKNIKLPVLNTPHMRPKCALHPSSISNTANIFIESLSC